MPCQCRGVSQDHQFHAGAGDGDVHAAQVAEETDLPFVVGAYEADHDHVALLSLEAVYGVDGYQAAEGFEESVALDQSADILNLRFVRRDQAEVDAFVQDPLFADLFDILLQSRDKQCRFILVDTAHAVGEPVFLKMAIRRVEPDDRRIEFQDAAMLDFRCGLQLVMVEPAGRKAHDVLVHPVLCFQKRDGFGFPVGYFLHQGVIQAAACRFHTFNSRRELVMVARQNDPVRFADRNPAGGFERLGGLVDKESREVTVGQHPVGRTDQRAGYDTRLVEQFRVDLHFQFRCPETEAGEAVAGRVFFTVARFAEGGLFLADRLAASP